jgi:hypothetical protein
MYSKLISTRPLHYYLATARRISKAAAPPVFGAEGQKGGGEARPIGMSAIEDWDDIYDRPLMEAERQLPGLQK